MVGINNASKIWIDKRLVKKTAEKFLKKYGLAKKEISVAFINDKEMRKFNKKYRRFDRTTDVLTFFYPALDFPSGGKKVCLPFSAKSRVEKELAEERKNFLGEILISPSQVKKQASQNRNGFKDELLFVLIHGLLHLAGYNDETEKERQKMIRLGKEFLIFK